MRYSARLLMFAVLVAGLGTKPAHAADRPTTGPAEKTIPAKALVELDKLKPAVSKPPSTASEVPRRAKKAVTKARELMADGKYAVAVPLLVERALGFAPNSAEVHRLLAEAYMKLPDPGKAMVHMRKSLAIDGDSIAAQVKLAQLLIAQKQTGQAIITLRTALKCSQSKPENALTGETLFRLGRLLDEAGYWTAALDCFQQLGDNIDSHARTYASRPLLRSIVLRPQRLLARRGELHARLKQPAKAAPLLKRAFSRDRTNVKLASLVVESLAASKQFKQAETFLVELAAQPLMKSKLPAIAAGTAVASGDKAMPMRIWKALGAAKRDSGTLAVALAGAAEKLGAPDQGSDILQSALNSNPGDGAVTKFIVKMYVSQGKTDKVLGALAKLLAADPSRDDIVSTQLKALAKRDVPKDFAAKFAGKIAAAPKQQKAALHSLIGRFSQIRGDKSPVTQQYAKAIAADPAFLPTYAHLAAIYAAQDKNDKLAELLKNLDKIPGGQESVAYYYARGKVLLAMSKIPQAEKALANARKLDPKHVGTLEATGDLMLLSGRAGEAARAFHAAAALNPAGKHLNNRLFEAYMKMRAFRDAKRLADAAMKRDPDSSAAMIMLARVQMGSGQYKQAAKILDEMKAKFPKDPAVALMAIRVEVASVRGVMFKKDFERLAGQLEEIIKSGKAGGDADTALATLMLRNAQYARAEKLWDKVFKTRKDDFVRRARIQTLMGAGKYGPAADAVREMLAMLPNDPVLRNQLVTCLKLDGKSEQAYAALKQWLSQTTSVEKAVALRFQMINTLRGAKLYDLSQQFMDDWILVDPQRIKRITGWKLATYMMAKKPEKAIAYAEGLLARSPRNHGVKKLLIAAISETKAYDKAHKLLDKWIAELKSKPDNSQTDEAGMPIPSGSMIDDYQGLKAGLYVTAGKFDKADAYALAQLKQDPGDIRLRLGMLAAMEAAKEYDKAIARLDAWIKQLAGLVADKPSDTKIAHALKSCRAASVGVLIAKKDHKGAIKRADECLKSDPANTIVLTWRASALNEIKQTDKALADIRKIYQAMPSLPLYQNNLGYQLADMGLELTQAEQLIRQSLARTTPTSSSYVAPLDSLAWVLYKQGKLQTAGSYFLLVIKRSAELDYTHPILFDHAGDGFYRLGWTDKAVELWNRALKLAADDKTDSREVRNVKRDTPNKIKAAKAGKPVQTAPLGKGVKIENK